MAVVRKIPCVVRAVTDHGEHVYTVELEPSTPVPRFKPGQFLHLALDPYEPGGFWPESRVFSIASSPAERDRLADHLRGQGRVHHAHGARAGPGRQRLGQAAVRRVRGRPDDATRSCSPGGRASRRSRRSSAICRPRAGRACRCSTGRVRPTCSSTAISPRGAQARSAGLDVHLVCEETDGRLDVDAAWPAIEPLRDPAFYLSGPPPMLAALTVQLSRRGVPPGSIRTDAWE